MNKNNNMKIVLPTIIGGLIVGAGFGSVVFPQTSVVEKIVDHNISVDKIVEVPVYQNVTVEKIVEVDNGNLNAVLQDIYDNNGNETYLTADLKETELNKIVDRIVFINDIKSMSVNETFKRIANEVSGKVVNGTVLKSYDITKVAVDDWINHISIKNTNFKFNDATSVVSGQFDQFDITYNFTADVRFKGYQFDRISNVNVVLK